MGLMAEVEVGVEPPDLFVGDLVCCVRAFRPTCFRADIPSCYMVEYIYIWKWRPNRGLEDLEPVILSDLLTPDVEVQTLDRADRSRGCHNNLQGPTKFWGFVRGYDLIGWTNILWMPVSDRLCSVTVETAGYVSNRWHPVIFGRFSLQN
jgi:hypothetical protein